MELLTNDERELADWLQERHTAILDLIQLMANIDSGSRDKAGVDAVGDLLRGFLNQAGVSHETIPLESRVM